MLSASLRWDILIFLVCLPTVAAGQEPTLINPDSTSQLTSDADAAYRRHDFAATIRLTDQALRQNPNDAVAFYLRGSARVETGISTQNAKLVREGIEDARHAIQADRAQNANYYLPYLYGMTHLTVLEGDREHAELAVRTATEVIARTGLAGNARSNILYQRALAHSKLGDFQSAAADFRQTLQLDESHVAARVALADALYRQGDLKSAEDEYSTAVARFPENALVFNKRGIFYQSLQQQEKAITDFSKALELNPEFVDALLNRGFTELTRGDYAAAESDFSRAAELKPDHAPAHSLLATSILLQNKVHESFEHYLRVIELRPSYAPARADIGFAYFFARHYDTAAQAFEQAITLAPESDYLIPWRYAALSLAGKQDTANQQYGSIAEAQAEDRNWFDNLTLFFMGQLTEQDLLAAIEQGNATLRDAQLCEAYYFIGLRLQKDRQGDAAQYFQRAVDSKATQLSAYRAAKLELSRVQQ